MKVLLVNIYPQSTAARYMLSSYVLKAYINRHKDIEDLSVEVLNFKQSEDVTRISDVLVAERPDCIGYSCYIWNIEKIRAVVKILTGKTKAVHVLGGPEISHNNILPLAHAAIGDYYIVGEGEKALLKLLSYLRLEGCGLATKPPEGITYRTGDDVIYSENTDVIRDLDDIPSIYLSGAIEERLYARHQAFIETQRGCKFKCKYCVYHKSLSSISYHSAGRVQEELEYLIVKKEIKALRIFDAVFTSNIARAKDIINYLLLLKKRSGIRLPWIYWEMTIQHTDEEFFSLTAQLKYRADINNHKELQPQDRPQHYSDMLFDYTAINCIGIQSFNKESLRSVGRPGISIKKLTDFMNMAKRYNVVLKVDLILGLPCESFETYFEGLEFFLPFFKNTDHVFCISRLQILPGSDLEASCSAYNLIYSAVAPHIIFFHANFSQERLIHAARLSAVLSRMINSPLRHLFFKAHEHYGKSFLSFLNTVYSGIKKSPEFHDLRLLCDDAIDDDYWNETIYQDIPSKWLINYLQTFL